MKATVEKWFVRSEQNKRMSRNVDFWSPEQKPQVMMFCWQLWNRNSSAGSDAVWFITRKAQALASAGITTVTSTHTQKCLYHKQLETCGIMQEKPQVFGELSKNKGGKSCLRQQSDTPKPTSSSQLRSTNYLGDWGKSPSHTPTNFIKPETFLVSRAGKCSWKPLLLRLEKPGFGLRFAGGMVFFL